jgi:hypothetical protein
LEIKWRKFIHKFIKKSKDKGGSGVINGVIIFLFCMLLLSVAFEYLKVQIIAYGIRDNFERAVLTVASENYNEVYAGFREIEYTGGVYEGGPAGGGNIEEIPEWLPLNDYGNVMDELQELLNLVQMEDDTYVSETDNYILNNMNVEVRDQSSDAGGRYEIRGDIRLQVPLYFANIKITDIELPVKIKTAYTPKY